MYAAGGVELRVSHHRRVYIVGGDGDERKAIMAHLATVGAEAWPISSGAELIAVLDRLAPGCVLLDFTSSLAGMATLDALRSRVPGWPVIGIGHPGGLAIAVDAMKRGASDFLCKPVVQVQLAAALAPLWGRLQRAVELDEAQQFAKDRVTKLTPREFDVFLALVMGKGNKCAAHQLGISVRTVEMHRARIMAKLGVRSLSEATLLMTRAGIDLAPVLPFRSERGAAGERRAPPAYRMSDRMRAAAS